MNSIAIRELARIQSLLHVLKTQRDMLSELADIQAFRGLEESYRDDLEEAQKRGLVASDPVADIRSDWLRLVSWSNRIQLALRAADNLGNDLDRLGPKPDKESGKKKKKMEEEWRPSLSDLQQLKMALEGAPRVLVDAIEQGCRELQLGDWSSGRPYGELAEVADAMEWTEKLELAESPGPWAHGIGLRDRYLVASRLAVEGSSPMVERRQRSLKDRLAHVVELIERHSKHAATLDDVGRLTTAGQVVTARGLMATVQSLFIDLDYSAIEQKLSLTEQQLETHVKRVVESTAELQDLGCKASGFFMGPPLDLRRRARATVNQAETLLAETFHESRRWPSGSEIDRTVAVWTAGLKSEVEAFKSGPMSRVRRWILGTTVFWLVILVAGGVTFQQVRAGQERELLRVVAEAKAAEEKANQPNKTPAQRIPDLRNAHEKFSEAHQLSPVNPEAERGESDTKNRLAEALKQEGMRNAQTPLSLKSSRREPRLPEVDASKLEQGISQLEESQQLRPGDSQVEEALKKAKDRLADAKVKQAETFLALEEQIPITKEKLALLRMAREQIDHALEQSPNHQEAQRTGEEIDRRMAQVHEDEGDFQEQQSAFSQPEQQAMQLSQALDHFQQASELRPNQPRLQAKQEQAEQKLAQTLDKLADKLMQSPGAQEPMEAKAARLEGAEQTLNELQAIKPSDRTAQRAEQVGKQLDGLRQMLAEKGQTPSESPGQGDPRNGAQPMPAPPQWMVPPLDGPPRINQPGNQGQAPRSAGRNIRDY